MPGSEEVIRAARSRGAILPSTPPSTPEPTPEPTPQLTHSIHSSLLMLMTGRQAMGQLSQLVHASVHAERAMPPAPQPLQPPPKARPPTRARAASQARQIHPPPHHNANAQPVR